MSFNGLAQPFVQSYKYDSLYRLTEAKETQNSTQTWKQNFVYDRYGNRTGHEKFIGSVEAVQNNVTHPTIDVNTNRFNGSQGFTYDKNGNLITDPTDAGRSFVFNGDNKQKEVRDANNNLIGEYFYDGEGRRVKKLTYNNGVPNETTVFVYSSGKLIAEYSTAAPEQNPTTKWTVTDQLGSPRILVDSLGQVVARRDFMPFGEEVFPDGTHRKTVDKYTFGDNVRQKFTGYQKDEETQLDFAESRMYENRHGRFTAVDPLLASGKSANPQTFNRYVYVANNPVRFVDPNGLQMATAPDDGYIGVIHTVITKFGELLEQVNNYANWKLGNDENYYSPAPPPDSVYRETWTQNGIVPRFVRSTEPVGKAIQAGNKAMDDVNKKVVQRTPLLSNLVNAQLAGMEGDNVTYACELGMFGFDLGTTVFSGGTAGTLRRGAQEGVEFGARNGGYNLALGLADNLDDFARATKSTTYVERYGRTFTDSNFQRLAAEASEINFNVGSGFSITRYSNWQKPGRPDGFDMITNYELDTILSNPELRRKTNFFVFPTQ